MEMDLREWLMNMATYDTLLQIHNMQEVGNWESPYRRIATCTVSIWISPEIQHITKQSLHANTATCHYAKKTRGHDQKCVEEHYGSDDYRLAVMEPIVTKRYFPNNYRCNSNPMKPSGHS
jgi:hypothetical protein